MLIFFFVVHFDLLGRLVGLWRPGQHASHYAASQPAALLHLKSLCHLSQTISVSLHHNSSLFSHWMAYRTALSVVHQIQLTRHGHGGSPSARAAVQPPVCHCLRRIVVLPSRFSTAARSSTSRSQCPPGHGLTVLLCTGRQCGIVTQWTERWKINHSMRKRLELWCRRLTDMVWLRWHKDFKCNCTASWLAA